MMPETVSAFNAGIDRLDGLSTYDWTTTPTRMLNLAYNGIGNIETNDFQGLTELISLILEEVGLTDIDSGDFAGLPKLERLTLDEIVLDSLEVGDFSGLTSRCSERSVTTSNSPQSNPTGFWSLTNLSSLTFLAIAPRVLTVTSSMA